MCPIDIIRKDLNSFNKSFVLLLSLLFLFRVRNKVSIYYREHFSCILHGYFS